MHLFQLEIITTNFHALYITKNDTLLCDVTMTLIRQEKNGNIFFLKQHTCFLKKMNINHFHPKMHTAAQISTKRPALYKEACGHAWRICVGVLSTQSSGRIRSRNLSKLSKGSDKEGSSQPCIINCTTTTFCFYYRPLELACLLAILGLPYCSCPTCADDVALLAKFLLFLQILLMVVKYFLGRERYGINTSKSTEVVLNDVTKEPDEGKLLYGTDEIERSDSETHLRVDRNCAATVDLEAQAQTGRTTM